MACPVKDVHEAQTDRDEEGGEKEGKKETEARKRDETHHVFPALHELLVDDLARVVLARLDVHGLLHDRIRSATESPASAVLPPVISVLFSQLLGRRLRTWQGMVVGGAIFWIC